MPENFVHLHLHTQYSLLDGAIRPKDLAARAVEFGMSAVAMTDHGNLYGAIEFYKAMKSAGVKPIIGCEIYLAPTLQSERREVIGRKRATHMTLLAKDNKGFDQLSKLVSDGHLNGSYYGKPRVDRELLAKYSEGIIALSGCINGPVNEFILQDQMDLAREEVKFLKGLYGEDFYLEIHNHGLENQQKSRDGLVQLSQEFDVPLVAANDVHFLNREDHDMHDIMICIGTGKKVIDQNRMSYSEELYFKSAKEMREVFADFPQACDATLEIADKINIELVLDPTSTEKYPQFGTPDGSDKDAYLAKVCQIGLAERYGDKEAAGNVELQERLAYEIKIINDLGFASYFLITADFIQWARDNDIPVGPGRGSAAGSLVAYTMGITDICPMRFGLLFERFLNPERVSPPDVDIDFCQSRRVEVIEYVRQKYGEQSVSHIITYGKMGAKSVIRDVARVMDISYGEADALAKMIDPSPGMTLKKAYAASNDLQAAIEGSSVYQDLWRYAEKLEGLARNVGVHAAGVVIGDQALTNHVPLTRGAEGEVVTQYDMGAITDVGLLKMDFLGLKNLTVIHQAEKFIRAHQPDFEVAKVPLDNQATFDLLNRGETLGVFQLESGGMVDTCRKYQITKIDDIIDLLALYRPGAMQFIDQMIEVKKGIKDVEYEHPLLEEICGDTYGVMIYQEQVQNAAKLLAGYTLGGADLLRRAMGKKDPAKMAQERVNFVKGCKETNDIDEKLANAIFEKIEMFAGYGFNKSHSACYGHISYWTAYLKANHPVEFMSAILSNELNNTDKLGIFVNEVNRMGIEILPASLNHSQLLFTPSATAGGTPAIRYGLAAVKNVGEKAMKGLIESREKNGVFDSLDDLANRLDSKVMNKRVLESLIRAGALDWTGEKRAALMLRLDEVLDAASTMQRDREQGQSSLFGMDEMIEAPRTDIVVEEWDLEKRLEDEKELLGYYVTAHPLDRYRNIINPETYSQLGHLDDLDLSTREVYIKDQMRQIAPKFQFAGLVRHVEHKVTKMGKKFGVLEIEDFTGVAEVVLWEESYLPAFEEGIINVGSVIAIKAGVRIDDRTGQRKLTGYKVKAVSMNQRKLQSSSNIELRLHIARHDKSDLEKLKQVLKNHPGDNQVNLIIANSQGKQVKIELPKQYRVKKSAQLVAALSSWF